MAPNRQSTDQATSDAIYNFGHPIGFYQKLRVLINLRRILLRNDVALPPGARVVDLGCGDGFPLRMIAELRGGSAGLVGLDRAFERLREARRLNDRIPCVRGDMRMLPFADRSCDLVTAFVSFMFLTTQNDVRQAAGEVSRILKDHGSFLVFDLVRPRVVDSLRQGFSADDLTQIVGQTGFRLIDRQTCFRNLLGARKLSTAYLPSRLPLELLLILERFPLSTANNVFLLFRKT